jgi:L-threonylcarbamoyladenylate synthase
MLDLTKPAELLANGGLVAFPTETVYGLGADATNPRAVARIYEAKGRPTFDPLIVHVFDVEALAGITGELNATAQLLAKHFWPGPMTLVLPKGPAVSHLVTSGLDTVAVRIPSHPVARELLEFCDVAVAAPSANSFGRISPTTAQHVRDDLGERVDWIVDGGPTTWGVESTIVDLSVETPTVLRHGALAIEDLRAVIGEVHDATETPDSPKAPGQLPSHYAPRVPLRIFQPGDADEVLPTHAYLGYRSLPEGFAGTGEVLAADGDLQTAAANLFSAMHRLDRSGASLIWAELVPAHGLGLAINDRLSRASKRD